MDGNTDGSGFAPVTLTNDMTKAHHECVKLMGLLDRFKVMDFELPEFRRKPEFSIEYLYGESRGKMLGVLVCIDESGNEISLKAFSSQYNGFWNIPGWVPPVLDPEAFANLVGPADRKIKKLDQIIKTASYNSRVTLAELKNKRKALSVDLMSKIQDLYRFKDFAGNEYGIRELWRRDKKQSEIIQGIPGGTGDCCAPKLLNYAALNNLTPVSISEFYYGKENASGTRKQRVFYPPCTEKCEPLLKTLAPGLVESGLTVFYKDEHIAVAEKPAGMLSVPGKGPEKFDSAAYRITRLFPESIPQPAVHRLDMATSGLLVFGLTKEAHRSLSVQFQKRQVKKRYTAVLSGVPEIIKSGGMTEGVIELPFRLDPDNRPYQVYDEVRGKTGKTGWKLLSVEDRPSGPGCRIEFIPVTGRTHQLRLHAAHPKGLGCPIVGDLLYGGGDRGGKDPRLLLHAEYLEFAHPGTGERMEFYSPALF